MSKVSDFSVIFCTVLGGFAVSLLHRTDFAVYIAITILTISAILIYSRLDKKAKSGKVSSVLTAGGSVISSALSVTAAASLITGSGVMPYKSYPLFVLVSGGLALCIAISKKQGFGSTITASVVISSLIFLILLFLCLVNVNFSAVRLRTPNVEFVIPLAVMSVFDSFLAMQTLEKPKKSMMLAGCITAGLYMSMLSLIAMSVLSETVFYEFNSPLVKMWQSTYIASFLNSFEIVCISAFYVMCAVKSGIMFRPAIKVSGKKYAVPLITAVYILCIILAFYKYSVFGLCGTLALLAIVIPIFVIWGK